MKCNECKNEMTLDIFTRKWYCDNCRAKEIFMNENKGEDK